ncbi:hypothetical protein BD311DRAFT_652119 [Dichomitus squalens]|uniref:Semialdehyde dehydrogenase NAD-binding domain-containing protein n=1 Tax=Dichomitus squalens TaxID=114155 RepID=A0A4Q9MZG5_9APHY|nr:hypothetical protein BD311DRAFT_652119 [Dichomitus squalens]
MSSEIAIFYIEATGYIGGSALQAILAHPEADTFETTALVRSEAKAKALESDHACASTIMASDAQPESCRAKLCI